MDHHQNAVPQNWPDLAISLYNRLTGQDAEITYAFENVEVSVPDKVGPNPNFAEWKVNGTIRVSTKDVK